MASRIPLIVMWVVLSASASAEADWMSDVGYTALAAELGAALPTGAGVVAGQVEGSDKQSDYAPDVSIPNFNGKTFTFNSGPSNDSNHATTVGRNFYGNTASIAPGIDEIELYEAFPWLTDGGLATSTTSEPAVQAADVQNHSWAGGFAIDSDHADAIDALRRFDYTISRDNYVAAVGLNNGSSTPVPDLLGHAYNAITVGVSSGNHSVGGTRFDGVGRVAPHIVSPRTKTSWATPTVAGAAAMMLEAGGAMGPGGSESETIRAALLAGATKEEFAWARTHERPLDDVYGAGELNVQRSYHVMAAGEQEAGSTPVSRRGWDFNNTSAGDATYFFAVPDGQTIEELSTVLTWNRVITDGNPAPEQWGDPQASLADLQLELWSASGGALLERLDYSESSVDNVEHVYQTYLDGGEYALRVVGDGTPTDYALAWYTSEPVAPPASQTNVWMADASTEQWGDSVNWQKPGAPDAAWDVVLSNDLTSGDRRSVVSADSTVRSVSVGGVTGGMIVEVEPTAVLEATDGVVVSAGGEVRADGQVHTPLLTLDAGRLSGDGSVVGAVRNDGRVAPGAGVGSLVVVGAYEQTAGGSIVMEVLGDGGPGVGHDILEDGNAIVGHDVLTVSGAVTLAGELVIETGGFVPDYGQRFELIQSGSSIDGRFGSVRGGDFGGGLSLAMLYGPNAVSAIAAIPGDANLDGVVDGLDIGLLVAGFGEASSWGLGDFNGDGVVDGLDIGILVSTFGDSVDVEALARDESTVSPRALAGLAAIPEPASAMLLALGGVALAGRRGRGR